jgi:hypothetical protein
MQRKVCGEFPDFCYKVYDCEEYAKQFIDDGIFRMGCRLSYKFIEDESRRDETEGFGSTKEPGIVTIGWVSPNPTEKTIWTKEPGYQEHKPEHGNAIFCFCTCLPSVDFGHMKKIGKYIIKIDDPRKLAEDINDYLFDTEQKFLIVGCNVVYNKGQKFDEKLTDNERLDFSYKQKPEGFSLDCEFRIVAIKYVTCDPECKFIDVNGRHDPKCKYIEINLGKKLDYLSLVKGE